MSYKFGQTTVSAKEFNRVKQITDISWLILDNIVVADPVDSEDDQRYIIGYKTPDAIIPLYVKTPKNVFSNGVTQYKAKSPWTMGFDVGDHDEWVAQYRKIWARVEEQIFRSLAKSPLNKDKYLNPKLKQYNERITTNFHKRPIPYAQYCEATGVIKIASVYVKDGKLAYPQVYVEECKYRNMQTIYSDAMLSDDDDYDMIDQSLYN